MEIDFPDFLLLYFACMRYSSLSNKKHNWKALCGSSWKQNSLAKLGFVSYSDDKAAGADRKYEWGRIVWNPWFFFFAYLVIFIVMVYKSMAHMSQKGRFLSCW